MNKIITDWSIKEVTPKVTKFNQVYIQVTYVNNTDSTRKFTINYFEINDKNKK